MRRSQLATIVMAGINDVGGVCVGGVLGHLICTGLAVICGALIAKRIPVRMVTLLGNMSEIVGSGELKQLLRIKKAGFETLTGFTYVFPRCPGLHWLRHCFALYRPL